MSDQVSDSNGSAGFSGFANAPRDKKGKAVDFRDVDNFDDTSDEGQIRKASQEATSSIVAFRTEGPSTNGAPAAIVPAPKQEAPKDAKAAEGQGANGS